MNLSQAFATYLQSLSIATIGQDLFIGRAPSTMENLADGVTKVPDNIWWIITNGGSPIKKNQTGESLKSYQVQIYCRNTNPRQMLIDLYTLEEDLNCDGCSQLSGVDTVDIEATVFPIDDDLDSEERKVGLLQVNLTTYKECI